MSNPELTRRPSDLDRKAKAAARALSSSATQRPSATRKIARGLGWFSIGLGLVELLASRRLARAIGMPASVPVLRLFGLREITTGVGLLSARDAGAQAGWVGARIGGDALDLGALAAGGALRGGGGSGHPLLALAAVAGVTAVDLACAATLRQEAHAARQTTDYSDRAGIRLPRDTARLDEPAIGA